MSAQYIQVKRRKYACGLLWQPMVAGFTTRAYAYKLARGIDRHLNLYVAYNGMIGLGARANGLRSGMPSVAIEIINSLPGYASMLGVFQVQDKFVLIAVRNGVILHDLLFADEEEAREKYAELAEIPDWNALFAPAAWAMPRASERDLADIFSGTNHGVLRPISRLGSGLISLLMLAAFAFLFLYVFREPLNQMFAPKPQIARIDTKLAEEYKRQIEEKNKELDKEYNLHQEKVLQPLVMPFDSLPNPVERAELCYRAIGFVMQPITGWNQTSAECGEKYAVATFKRSFGTLEDFYVLVADAMPGVFVQEISDDEIMVRAKLPLRSESASQDERDAESVIRDLTSRFQAINLDATTSIVTDIVSNETQSAELFVVQISADSKLIPVQFMQIFDGFGGLYMPKAVWNAKRKTWNYEVIIYAK